MVMSSILPELQAGDTAQVHRTFRKRTCRPVGMCVLKGVIMSGLDDPAFVAEFLDRFLGFEDGVITGISIWLPRADRAGRRVELEVQALDRRSPTGGGLNDRLFEWKLVRIIMHGVEEYSLSETKKYPLQVLSDGLQMGVVADRFLLDLDPGPDGWSPLEVRDRIGCSMQYVMARSFSFEVSDGPFI